MTALALYECDKKNVIHHKTATIQFVFSRPLAVLVIKFNVRSETERNFKKQKRMEN